MGTRFAEARPKAITPGHFHTTARFFGHPGQAANGLPVGAGSTASGLKRKIQDMSAKVPVFTGNANGLVPAVGAVMKKNAFGIDVLTRPFTCPRAKVQNLVPKKGTADIFYPRLKATGNYSITEKDGLMCSIDVEYKGLLNGVIPDPILSYSKTTGSLGYDAEAGGEQRSYNCVYQSDVLQFHFVNDKPKPPASVRAPSGGGLTYNFLISQFTVNSGPRKGESFFGNPPNVSAVPVVASQNYASVPGTPFYEGEISYRISVNGS